MKIMEEKEKKLEEALTKLQSLKLNFADLTKNISNLHMTFPVSVGFRNLFPGLFEHQLRIGDANLR